MNLWQGTVLAIHLTETCNLNCSYCYLTSVRQSRISYEYIQKAVQKIKPDTVFLYGGEPLLCQELIVQIVENYPDKNIIFETNGLLLTDTFMEYIILKNVGLILSLDSYSYELNSCGRPINRKQFQQLLKIIIKYKNYPKLRLMCSIHEQTSDFTNFCRISESLGISFETYLIVSNQGCNITETSFYHEYQKYPRHIIEQLAQWHDKPNLMPKLRLHCNGMVSRTLNRDEAYSICHIEEWEDSKVSLGVLPYPKSCELCSCFNRCNLLGSFSHWAFNLEQKGVLNKTFACQASGLLAKYLMGLK